jgi:hypothetical protein
MRTIGKIILLGSLSYLIGCAIGYHLFYNVKKRHDDHFEPYIAEFEREIGVDRLDLTIEFYNIKQDEEKDYVVIGECYHIINHIRIHEKAWNRLCEIKKKALIFHEMTHCVCGITKHDDTKIKIYKDLSCPKTIMHAYSPSLLCLLLKWDEYILELRKACGTNKNY